MALVTVHSRVRLALLAGSRRAVASRRGRSTAAGPAAAGAAGEQWRVVYEGGLSRVARVMKLASVASVVGATAAVPLFFAAESDVPTAARAVLAATTLGMTGTSTGLLAWALRPYITSLAVLDGNEIGPHTPLLVDTMTLLARRHTRL
ncbi:hypothetical protein IWQ57_006196, partial [Coemansia nantahalensis]